MDDPARVSIYVSDRHFGIGSDGLITIGPSDKADFRMRIYNADGSEAEMTFSKLGETAIIIDHTLVPDVFRGQGIGLKLVQRGVDDARAAGKKIIQLCPFAAAQFKRHPEWADVLKA